LVQSGSRLDDERPYGVQQFDTHTWHTVEPTECAKWTVFGTPRHDPLRQRRTDARQSCDFAHVGVIEIDALTRQEGTGKLRRATSSLAQTTCRNDGGRLKSNVTGRCGWRRR